MQEAEVAQQLINDLQANLGIILGAIALFAAIGIGALIASLNNASRALREWRESVAAGAPAATYALTPPRASGQRLSALAGAGDSSAAQTPDRNRPRRGSRDLVTTRRLAVSREPAGHAPKPRPVPQQRSIV